MALVSEYYYPDVGGMPECVHHLARGLARRGHEPVIITSDFGSDEHDMDRPARVVRLGRSLLFYANGSLSRATVGWRLGRRMREVLAAERFDVIHLHGPLFPTLPLLAIQYAPPGARLLGTLHTFFGRSGLMRLCRGALAGYVDALDGLTAVSESAGRSVDPYLRCSYRVIPNGVDLDWCEGGRRRPELSDGRTNFLFMGRLEPRNEVPRLLAAFVAACGQGPPMRLIILGDGPERGALAAMVPRRLRGAVVFAGTVLGERPRYLASADVYCFTTRIGASPVSLLEAMAAGLPVIAPDIEPVRHLVEDGVQGRVVSAGSTEEMAAAMVELACDRYQRQRMGQAARARAEPLSWDGVVDQYLQAYHQIL